jgi:hypothetical protein
VDTARHTIEDAVSGLIEDLINVENELAEIGQASRSRDARPTDEKHFAPGVRQKQVLGNCRKPRSQRDDSIFDSGA